MNIILTIILFFIIIFIIFNIFILILNFKIRKLEENINELFNKRNDLIPAIFEISKKYLIKHNIIFKEIINLRKNIFFENNYNWNFIKIIKTQELIHKEINFIFKICNKHEKLLIDWKFIYLRDIIIDKSYYLWKKIELYKLIIIKFNILIKIKNLTIIWILIPINYIDSI